MNYRRMRLLSLLFVLVSLAGLVTGQERRMTLSGEILSPAYEGWWPNDDGTFKLFFGYMNSNWQEELVREITSPS
jgi:hypothetical protein